MDVRAIGSATRHIAGIVSGDRVDLGGGGEGD